MMALRHFLAVAPLVSETVGTGVGGCPGLANTDIPGTPLARSSSMVCNSCPTFCCTEVTGAVAWTQYGGGDCACHASGHAPSSYKQGWYTGTCSGLDQLSNHTRHAPQGTVDTLHKPENKVASGVTTSMPDGMDHVLWFHNNYRCMHGLDPVSWDDSIAASAQDWADSGTCDELVHSGGDYGENIYWASPAPSPEDLWHGVDSWYSEIEYTDGGRTSDWCDSKCGHYTQVVWKSTTAIGCGTCGGTMVCQYNPPGNYQGDFDDNVPAAIKTWDECAGENLVSV